MKELLRSWLINLLILWLLAEVFATITFRDINSLLLAGILLTSLQLLVLPVIRILFTPISLISFGTLSWIPTVLMFFVFSWLELGYMITAIRIPSISIGEISLPSVHLGTIGSILFFTWIYSVTNRVIRWVLK